MKVVRIGLGKRVYVCVDVNMFMEHTATAKDISTTYDIW